MKVVLMSMVMLMLSFSATAGCWLGDTEYPVGSIVDGYECGSDGNWEKV